MKACLRYPACISPEAVADLLQASGICYLGGSQCQQFARLNSLKNKGLVLFLLLFHFCYNIFLAKYDFSGKSRAHWWLPNLFPVYQNRTFMSFLRFQVLDIRCIEKKLDEASFFFFHALMLANLIQRRRQEKWM